MLRRDNSLIARFEICSMETLVILALVGVLLLLSAQLADFILDVPADNQSVVTSPAPAGAATARAVPPPARPDDASLDRAA